MSAAWDHGLARAEFEEEMTRRVERMEGLSKAAKAALLRILTAEPEPSPEAMAEARELAAQDHTDEEMFELGKKHGRSSMLTALREWSKRFSN